MTVITYSNGAGRLLNQIQVPERPSAYGNVPQPFSEDLELGTMLDPLEIKRCSWVRSPRLNEDKETKKGGNIQRERQTLSRTLNSRRKENHDRNTVKGKDGNVMLLLIENKGEIRQREKGSTKKKQWLIISWLLHLIITSEEKMKMQMNISGLKWHHVFVQLLLLFLSLSPKLASSQGHFPRMENIAAFKPVSTSPPRSTCGFPERRSYCQTPLSRTELLTCYQAFCVQECPYRSSTPPYAPLLLAPRRGTCVMEDAQDTHFRSQTETDGRSTGSGSLLFQPGQDGCLISPPSQALGALGSFTLALWIKPSSTGEMMLLEKSLGARLIFSVTVSEQTVTLRYGQSSTETYLTVIFRTEGRLRLERWTHLTLQIHDRRASLFLDGLEEDGTPFDTKLLTSAISDISDDSAMWVGLSSNGSNQFIGQMQDFRFYPATLTNREIVELYSGVLPELHVQSECRCPPSHSRVHPLVERYCIPNAVEDTTNDRVLRLNINAHPLSYINDQDMGTTWLSKIMTTQELDEGVTIIVNLANGQYQVFYVILQFGGPLPESVLIQRRKLDLTESGNASNIEQPWLDWQYMARNCNVFEMQNDGPILKPDGVNCLQLPSDMPLSGGNITFSLLTTQPNLRPGYNDFYNTPALQEMVQAAQVRILLSGQYYTRAARVNQQHRYFAINEITISGRCECHGHADHCDTSVTPYRCLCLPESHTIGNNCQRCAPLYNDKPFRSGDQLQPMNCRPCQCHGHALSCRYDVLVDDQPYEHYRGGGGVCDNCRHNTTGKNCDLCKSGFFRLEDSDPSSADVCQPCNCYTAGTVNSSMGCIQIGGQCQCKAAVTGRQCSDCLPGWFGLNASNPNGCIPCNCSDLGIIMTAAGAVASCSYYTGQCQCKPHVSGVSCDRCEFGYWNLSHPDGCIPCDCDPLGSLSPFCEPEGGQCECKPGVGGRRCDSCGSGLYGLRLEGSCAPCICSHDGTVPGTDCNQYTGQCVCKEHVEGRRCDSCRHGYHTLEHRNSLGCLPCMCDFGGTVPGGVCDSRTGQCPCKDGVKGAQCTNCMQNYYNRTLDLHKGLSQGCVPCICDSRGTVMGSVCDSTTGQCVCLPTRYGKDCSSCRPGFYLSPNHSMCLECDCHPMGALQSSCESRTGQCVCVHPSVGGQRCDQCHEMFFGFNPGLGRCQPCACNQEGSISGSCHPDTGACVCKLLVTGDKCDSCQPGANHFDPENHLGCSKAPSQQPAPMGFAPSYSSLRLSWHPPDSPNSHRINYTLIRDGQSVHLVNSHYPFSTETFEDNGLFPFTNYSYWLVTANIAGETVSPSVSYQTLGAPPSADELRINLLGRPGPTSASFNWSTPRNATGPVERFVLSSIESSRSKDPVIHYTGLSTEAVASGLKPFTQYTIILKACSSGGCTSSPPLALLTAAAPPQNQPPPRVTATGPHTLHASWEPPSQPNGVITKYEVFLRGPVDSQNLSSSAVEKRVFYSSGWLDPSVSTEGELMNRSTVSAPESSTVVADLQAFSTYQLRVVSINSAGSVTSDWSTARTMEGVPEFVAPPEVSALSSTSLKVTWSSTDHQGFISRGPVIEYRVNLLTVQTTNMYAPPVVSQVLHRAGPSSQPVYIVKGLKPYHAYNFTITLCNRMGCITSLPSTGRTLPAAPKGLSSPRLHSVNETSIQIVWDPPAQLNGPHPLYQVERADVSLSDPQEPVVRGTRFPGNGYYQFPSNTLPSNTDFTGVELSFKTRSPDGLLLCAFSPGDQEEFLAIQIKNGRPYFLFDPQGSAVAVSVQGDGGRLYNDGQWHSITAMRRGAVGTIVVNDQYSGSASASSGSSIIGENMGVFIGGLPEDFPLRREDSGDAQLVRQGFSGCLRDVSVKMTDSPSEKWQFLDWRKGTKKVEVYESWEGCPPETVEGAHFLGHGYLELDTGVFSGGQDFDISMDFRTDQLNALLLFSYNTQSQDYMLVELEAGLLSFILSSDGHVTELSTWVGLSYCDGDWKKLSLAKRSLVISAAVNDWAEETRGVGGAVRLSVDSPLYLGGVPLELIHPALNAQSHKHGLGGCIRGLTIRSNERNPPAKERVNLAVASRRSVRVYLDGCPTSESRFHCRGNDTVLVYSGTKTQSTDYSVQPFTEYLYRFVALAAGGWASSPWQRGRSHGKVPTSVPPPTTVKSISGFSAKVSWEPPIGDTMVLIDRYVLKAYNKDHPEEPPIKTTYLANGNFTGVMTGLTPSTRYVITISACTPGGCTESLINESNDDNGSILTTPEEAPTGVTLPPVVSSPSSLFVTWSPPARPNGVITEYLLYHNHQTVYRGKNRQHNITGLDVYSTHFLVLSACTLAGCANSSQVTAVTSQLPPGPLRAPTLTLLDSQTIFVEWSRPSQINGMLESYSIFLSHDGAEPTVAYNSSELLEDHTLRNLTPGTSYTITVAACTLGGCTLSPPSQVQTEESTPENVPAPLATPLSPHALNVSWTPPDTPNGVITSYGLWLDGALVVNSSSSRTWFMVKGLAPWSRHVLRLQACTSQGCGKGPMVEVRTLEMPPEGPILLELTIQSSRSLQARWTAPPRPNGNLSYTLLYKSRDGDGVMDGATAAGIWMSVTNLQPYTNYSFWIRGCNTQGCVESLPLSVTTPPAAPDGLSPPTLARATNTSLNVSWSAPVNSNARGPLHYSLQMRTSPQKPVIKLLENATDTFSYYVDGLSPYTHYLFRVVVSHTHGQTAGPWATLCTAEDSPGALNIPTILGLHSRSVLITWVPPTQPNGIITNYSLYLQPGSSTSLDDLPSTRSTLSPSLGPNPGLLHITEGARLYSDSNHTTLFNHTSPHSSSHISMSSISTGSNNGLSTIQDFIHTHPNNFSTLKPHVVEGNETGSTHKSKISQVPSTILIHLSEPNSSSVHLSNSLSETEYSPSSYNPYNVVKREPSTSPISSSYSAATGTMPLSVTLPGNTTSYTFLDLLPYQTYSLQMEACNSVGCSVSWTPQQFRTLPAPPEGVPAPFLYSDTPTSVLLSWGAPERSNGPLERWLIERRLDGTKQVSTVGQVSPDRPPFSFLDSSSALSPWTSYQYRLVLHNQAGHATGPWVSITTRPSRPAGLSPPGVKVLGPESLQVSWSPPLIPNGEIRGYEIRLPEPRFFHDTDSASELNVTIANLVPYTNHSVTVLACSEGGGHVGGCTESLPTFATTFPTSPEALAPLSIVAVSESFLAISWQPPSRPNGPNIRYKLLRRKTHQPLAVTSAPTLTGTSPPPSEDLHRWLHVYSGTKLFYQDKGLSRFTRYQYQLEVHNDVGSTSGETVPAVTMAGVPLNSPSLSARAVNHTAVQVNWTQLSLQDLQGEVEYSFLTIESPQPGWTLSFGPEIKSTIIANLWPGTRYQMSLQVSNGAHNTTKAIANVTTKDGEPEGMSAPEIVAVNSSTVRVLWVPPLRPNGAVIGYNLYVDGRLHGSAENNSGSYLLRDLLPFTVYDIQVEVCTVYACARSNVTQTTTVEDLPADLSIPHVKIIGPRLVRLDWSRPGKPSGIMLGYEVLRRTLRSCNKGSPGQTQPSGKESDSPDGSRFRCSYLQCPPGHGVCGTSCFQPDIQVCCSGLFYTRKPHHHCCEGRYLHLNDSFNPVCCNGKLVPSLPDRHCCGGYYVLVKNDEYCCPDHSQGRVSVGLGDSCCGGAPYSMTGGQLCCSGSLHDGYGVQCCGGRIVDDTLVCCGDAERGEVHKYTPGFVCCGQEYINSSASLCCLENDGHATIHPAGNATVILKCCGSVIIHQDEECCNGIGFDPQRHVCADRPTPGLLIQHRCLQGAVCPVAAAATAYCGSCDLDPSLTACTWVLTAHTPPDTQSMTHSPFISSTQETPSTSLSAKTIRKDKTYKMVDGHSHTHNVGSQLEEGLCPSHEEVVYSGDASIYTYTDSDREPFTTYEYRVKGWNSFGWAFSNVTAVTTNEDKPWGVAPPRWSRLGERDDIIQLQWQAPARRNGVITHYVILRDGQERYRGDEYSFTDVGGIRPFQEYSYQLSACNRAGCTESTKVTAVTVQGVPEDVQPPVVTTISSSSLHVSWSEPSHQNGIIQRYQLNQTGVGAIFTHSHGPGNYTVTGLQPYTNYSFVLVACTAVGCGASEPSTGCTLQTLPAGVWSRPRHLIINTSAVELYWDQPSQPNGLISQYRLIRDGLPVFTGGHHDQNYTDTGLLPNHRYTYVLEANTEGGTGVSDKYAIKTPVSCPTGIPPPHSVTVSGPVSISLAWSPPAQRSNTRPVNYNVLLNPGSHKAIIRHAGQDLHLSVTGLEPFTIYYLRVQACQSLGCGVGEGVYVRTLEAPPEGILPPTVKATGANVLEIHWTPPIRPNGLINSYHIYRRPLGTEEELLVFIWSSGPLEFVDASPTLSPFSYFQYKVRAHNSKGSVLSQWTLARTLQAEPKDMAPPTATPSGAHSVHLKWSEPGQSNGLISHYRLVYKKHQEDPTLNSTAVTALTVEDSVSEATVFGLQPYSQYSLRVEAVNGAGSVSSPWVDIRTLEASPTGLSNFTVEHREQGRALLLSWDEPRDPNGVITLYNVYSEGNLEFSGLSRSFLFRRLEPWTVYSLTLEACTSAGCAHTPPQHITTAPAPPAFQPTPRIDSIGPDHVLLAWSPPSQPNGPVGEYSLLGRSLKEKRRGSSDEEDIDGGKVLFRNPTPHEPETLSFTVTDLRPWTQYEFSVCSHNPAGRTCSPWVAITTRQAPPCGLASPTLTHLKGRPSEVLVTWTPPLEPNGVLRSYRIQRNNVSFSFSFDPTVLTYIDEDLQPFSSYSYSMIACTSEGCVTSSQANITTLEAPPTKVEAPSVDAITSNSMNISWSKPLMQNGEVMEYVLNLNNKEAYRGGDLHTVLLNLQPHTSCELVLLACTSGGCTTSTSTSAVTEEAPPTGLADPTLKVTGPESMEISWRPPQHPNGIITGYELRRNGEVIYVGTETHYHDFTLLPSMQYSYVVRANNSRGAVSSKVATAKTHPSAPSGVALPTLTALEANQVKVEWRSPARPNGDIVRYTVYLKDPVQLRVISTVFTPEDRAFSERHAVLHGLAPYYRYEVRMEACTLLGCASSDWSSVLTLEAPPAGQAAPLLDLQPDAHTGLQTSFLLTWSPPAQPSGRILHYEVHRRLDLTTDTHRAEVATVVCRNVSTSCKDSRLQPYTVYQYQVWAVNSAGRSASPWVSGRTGPAPPEGVGQPILLHVSATSAVVDIHPPSRPNGVVSLYRVFSVDHNNYSLLSEGTFRQQKLHGLRPYTQYLVGIEACTCYQCCTQGPLIELYTQPAPPAGQAPPRPVTLTSRSVQLEWDEPSAPNGVIESCELHLRSTCPQPPQPVPLPCIKGSAEICFFGKRKSFNVTGLQPYSSYELSVACFNNMGSTASSWTTVNTLGEAPQYVSPFSVDSNLTVIWLDWTGTFSLNGYLKEYTVTESQLRVYTGFYSFLHIQRISKKTLSFQVKCTTDSGSVSTPTVRYSPVTGLGPPEPADSGKQGVGMSTTPVYSELWFILLFALLGLFLLAILLGLVLQRALRKNPSARERPPLVMLQKTGKASGETQKRPCPELCSKHLSSSMLLHDRPRGLADTKIPSSSSSYSPMSVLRAPSHRGLTQAYSQNSLHSSVSQLIDKKALMMDEGSWDNPLGQDSGLYVEEDEFVDAIKALSSGKKEHTMFADTHL